jgi:hypothetical protein
LQVPGLHQTEGFLCRFRVFIKIKIPRDSFDRLRQPVLHFFPLLQAAELMAQEASDNFSDMELRIEIVASSDVDTGSADKGYVPVT